MKRFLLALTIGAAITTGGPAAGASDDGVVKFTVDVAEDFSRFVVTMVNPADTEPKRGAWFVTEGRIYPGGTIKGDGSTFDPSSAGSIGTWTCRGTHLISLTEILAGVSPWVATTQTYELPDDTRAITTDGVEGASPVVRAVTGGTGRFSGSVGVQRQQLLGFNTTGGVNLRVTFVLRRATDR
jgi:hypothetical protein